MSVLPHVLIVDDDPKIRSGLAKFLGQQGLRVSVASDGKQFRDRIATSKLDLIVLDVMLPDENGLSLLRQMQAENPIPVILLTAVAEETDRVIGLELGAEDYICKPFGLRELLARIRVVLRRQATVDQTKSVRHSSVFAFSGWTLDIRARTLKSPSGALVELTSGEYDLLQAFVEHPNRVLNRDQLLDLARGRTSTSIDRTIDVQVMRLRRKLEENPENPAMIKTVRNSGYIFTPVVENDAG
ncbi:response regulator [Bradyrhizobium liaoningense]|uniref:response regulator n=1 Tax=Bradyrhizobium liaoningense TaxID=43992 RepID=UPI001BAABE44|nr:response regulator [Bradyrhizobium liaoningense]MBR0706226.1 response regulator [Bradyrhizobium liaoningense]